MQRVGEFWNSALRTFITGLPMNADRSLLRLVTTGSVDDGKSTLIGRLLHETGSIPEDQYEAVRRTSRRRGDGEVDLSLLLDGLAAEREQAITIDVAYRYFSTDKRNFIIADCPGHEQYTRNMVTGASTAQLAIILIDARKGVLTQSKRHGFLVSLLGVPHLIVAVNKMDLADYSSEVYNAVVTDYLAFSAKLDIHDITFFPVSALRGDNVTARSGNMPWYNGHTLLHYLENVHVAADSNLVDFRFPVQNVIRPSPDFRGFAGRIASGTIQTGEEIVALPSGKTSRVTSIGTFDGPVQEAIAGQSVVLRLADEIDVGRGDMIVRRNNLPSVANRFEGIVCWMDEAPLSRSSFYLLKHTTHTVKAHVTRIFYTIDVNTLHRRESESLTLNEIARVELRTSEPLFFDPYRVNRGTGAFVLIDPLTNNTVAGGMIRGPVSSLDDVVRAAHPDRAERPVSPHTAWSGRNIPRERREELQGHLAAVLWITGLSGSGKSTVARALEKRLFAAGCRTMMLDGDHLRRGLCGDLAFSDDDRTENIRRAGEVARLFFENAALTICTFISPMRKQRGFVRSLIPAGRFLEIYLRCDVEVCKRRDPRGLYEKARTGEIPEFTGVTSPYEEPQGPELTIDTGVVSVVDAVGKIMALLREKKITNPAPGF